MFAQRRRYRGQPRFDVSPGHAWAAITVICICLFIGAMGKSAQVPLHVWLPDSMEGPTPISALIHAATMVTAGIFMVARMSPLFEHVGDGAVVRARHRLRPRRFFMGLLGIVNNDIKRVVAYSTLSQLGYMTVALGVSAYSAGDVPSDDACVLQGAAVPGRRLGDHRRCTTSRTCARWADLRKYMPITYWTCLIGSLALIGFPGFSGFFSKDAIIDAVDGSHRFGSGYAYFCVLTGVFITALYTFRMFFMTFHGKERMDHHTQEHLSRKPLGGDGAAGSAGDPVGAHRLVHGRARCCSAITSRAPSVCCRRHNVLEHMAEEFHGSGAFIASAFAAPPVWLAAAGVAAAYVFFLWKPSLAAFGGALVQVAARHPGR